MEKKLQAIIQRLRQMTPAALAGSVKTHPYRELLELKESLQQTLSQTKTDPDELERVYTIVQQGIAKRVEAAQQIVAKFAETTPEIIALKNSVFSLVPSRDVLEDIRTAFGSSPALLAKSTKASANILEAVNIELQQRFNKLSPELIAIHYTGQDLDSFRRLLKKLVTHIEVDSDIFKIYNRIIRHVAKATQIYKTHISITRALCHEVFQTDPPAYDFILGQYTAEELVAHEQTLKDTLVILEQDISGRPSILEFSSQCRQLLQAIPEHATQRKVRMRKATRVLRLSHYIEFLTLEQIPENSTSSLIFCLMMFEDTRRFLLTQQTHLDVALNIKSIEEAIEKIEDGLRFRLHAIGQLFKDVAKIPLEDLFLVPEIQLGDSNVLLQETQNLIEDFIHRSPSTPPEPIQELAKAFRRHIKKLHKALIASKNLPRDKHTSVLAFDPSLSNLSKFYDQELVSLIRKALSPESASGDIEPTRSVENLLMIPLERLQTYIETFIRVVTEREERG